jgi:hypothetical protein
MFQTQVLELKPTVGCQDPTLFIRLARVRTPKVLSPRQQTD